MNKIPNNLPQYIKVFLNKIRDYLDTELYFYGSVNRNDYIHGKSDIDIAIFTDNEYSTIHKLQHVLHIKRSDIDTVIWRLNNTIIYGFKIKCEKHININCEIAIYNNKFKHILLDEYSKTNNVPFLISILLNILKTCYYTFHLLSKQT